jgi:hypothetical protein
MNFFRLSFTIRTFSFHVPLLQKATWGSLCCFLLPVECRTVDLPVPQEKRPLRLTRPAPFPGIGHPFPALLPSTFLPWVPVVSCPFSPLNPPEGSFGKPGTKAGNASLSEKPVFRQYPK